MARKYQFYELANGSGFEFLGERFKKLAAGMARAEDGTATIFEGTTEVTVIGEVLLLSPGEAERWKPVPRWPYQTD